MIPRLLAAAGLAVFVCTSAPYQTAIGAAGQPPGEPILVTPSAIPPGVEHTVLGQVQAEARVGYDSAESLYPELAAEAKKLGANAVVHVKGGRKLALFSWSAAYVNGIAVKVEDTEKLKGITGTYH